MARLIIIGAIVSAAVLIIVRLLAPRRGRRKD